MKLTKSREEILKKAWDLGIEYEANYKGCCQSTFFAIIDALRCGGLELIPVDMQERLYSGLFFLTAGVCFTGEGTCGAVTGSVMAIGLALGIPREGADHVSAHLAGENIRDKLLEKYYDKYRSILCKDVMRKYFGKAWNLTDKKMTQEFLSQTDGCTIKQTALWTTDIILEEFAKGNIKLPA